MKKLFLVHIPKTAGTTVNDILSEQLPSRIHIEGRVDLIADLRTQIPEQFVSGHVSVPEVLSYVNREEWYIFSFLRSPLAQITSYMQWLQHCANFDFVESFGPEQKKLCFWLKETNLSDISRLREMFSAIPSAKRQFDNCQTRFICGKQTSDDWMGRDDLALAQIMMKQLDFVGFTENIGEDLPKLLADAGYSLTVRPRRSNPGPPSARPDFDKPEVLEFYRGLVQLDIKLFEAERQRREMELRVGT